MKREELEKLGLTKEQIDKVCDLHNADMQPLKTDLETARNDLQAAQYKVTVTEEALKKFEGVDAEALKKQISDLQEDLKKKDAAHAEELADRDFDALLKDSITGARGRNAKAIAALLDLDTLKASKNQKEDVAAALKELAEAEDSKMLFGEPEAVQVGTDDLIGVVSRPGAAEDDALLRAAMGLPPAAGQK
ncbi:MAG: phage scaffolding protein [Ruminococcus flavefaciens]|nr:phage scaffolding protein [Ruminococcus flavefaciens]